MMAKATVRATAANVTEKIRSNCGDSGIASGLTTTDAAVEFAAAPALSVV